MKTRASVLIPIAAENGDTRILLTRRTTSVKYHKGEISFPGGMYEEYDRETVRTAIRECGEEITPYVGVIPYPYNFRLNPEEVHYLIWLPLPFLMSCRPEVTISEQKGKAFEVFAIRYNGERIWGATCKLLLELRRILEDEKV
ncbi:MAG: CoA pyrophosphatase [Syntrophorhabdales bacterium]